jgi:hypothetical protein
MITTTKNGERLMVCDVCLVGTLDERSMHFCACEESKILCPSCYCEECEEDNDAK